MKLSMLDLVTTAQDVVPSCDLVQSLLYLRYIARFFRLRLRKSHILTLFKRQLVSQRSPLDFAHTLKVAVSDKSVMKPFDIMEQDMRWNVVLQYPW